MTSEQLNDNKMTYYFSSILDEKRYYLLLGIIAIAALALRLYVFSRWMDLPGDGPTKAMYAYNWRLSPRLIWHGIWLPGFEYLTGIFSFIVRDPLIAIRILNLVVGVLTVPVFYWLIRRIYGHISGLVAAILLAMLPVHVSLSVTSLNEVTFLFDMLASILFLLMGTEEGHNRYIYIGSSIFFLCMASMTRYEAWLLIPFFPAYYFLKTKKMIESVFIFLILSLLPLFWSVSNYIYSGNFLLGFTAAEDLSRAEEVNFFKAIQILGKNTVGQIEWTLAILAAWGLVLQVIQVCKRERISLEKILFLTMTVFYWFVMLRFAMVRGEIMLTRYLLFPVVIILPFIMIPIKFYSENHKRQLSAFICFILVSFALPKIAVNYPLNDLTKRQPVEIKNLANWLQSSEYNGQSILMTKLEGQATYLPLYYPDIGPHDIGHFIYYSHVGMSDERLLKYLQKYHPSILITCKNDKEFVLRIEEIIKNQFDLRRPVYTTGFIDVYDIKKIFKE